MHHKSLGYSMENKRFMMHFFINYHTVFGQNICLILNDEIIRMDYEDNGWWKAEVPYPEQKTIRYRYFLRNANNTEIHESGDYRVVHLPENERKITFHDEWQGNDDNSPFMTAPFTKVFFHHDDFPTEVGVYNNELIIRVTALQIREDETLLVSGNCEELGCWNVSKAKLMSHDFGCRWSTNINAVNLPNHIEFKIIRKYGDDIEWENGENHILQLPFIADNETVTVELASLNFNYGKPKYKGVAVPVFSLRSKNDCGIGDFLDIKKLVDWAVSQGLSFIQLLPVNDTTSSKTWHDSYPYAPISVMALNPMYLHIAEVRSDTYMQYVDYDAVYKLKADYSKRLFERDAVRVFKSQRYKRFFKQNSGWLKPYAAFCVLRDKYGTTNYCCWKEFSTYNQTIPEMLELSEEYGMQMKYYYFIQFMLDSQLREAYTYAHSHGVALKGDIPIGVIHDSVETWMYPHYFNLDGQAGAPPDFFSEDGQNWGFPTYNWDNMAADGYKWWKNRLAKMAEYFDAYRIDHGLGFFRIWEIPSGQTKGLMGHFSPALPLTVEEMEVAGFHFDAGIHANPLCTDMLFMEDTKVKNRFHPYIAAKTTQLYNSLPKAQKDAFDCIYDDFFYHRHNEFWKQKAYGKLPELISCTDMLCCAEDLGMIPDCVPEVLHNLHILTLDIQRMPKTLGKEYGNPADYPYLSVCTTGSHDTSTLRGWWQEDRKLVQKYYNDFLGYSGEAPRECTPEIISEIIRHHVDSPAMLTILPIQDWLAANLDTFPSCLPEEERINNPANPHNYWRYRIDSEL